MPKERPILFSAPMIRALLAGRKTQTRRIVKGAPDGAGCAIYSRPWQRPNESSALFFAGPTAESRGLDSVKCPYGQPGDRLWVRETWQLLRCSPIPDCDGGGWEFDGEYEGVIPKSKPEPYSGLDLAYAATHDLDETRWRPSIHMPRWASRLTLEITDVRVERLHAIQNSEADVLAEGLVKVVDLPGTSFPARYGLTEHTLTNRTAWAAYSRLWNQINGERAWDANPWVWVVEFKAVPA